MPTRIIDLPKAEWRARCLADTRKCGELSMHLDMRREDGDSPEAMSVGQILAEAADCLSYYSDGTAADACEDGCTRALRERRELRAFIKRWSDRLQQRKAVNMARAAARAAAAN